MELLHQCSRPLEEAQRVSLSDFFSALDEFTERIPLDYLVQKMQLLDVGLDDVRDFVQFGEDIYRRNLMYEGSAYQALVLCWKNGQRSPIHDHRGLSCGVKVLSGIATEIVFQWNEGRFLVPSYTQKMLEGSVIGSEDSDIHQVSNLQQGKRDLITLHIYSPPLLRMGTYSLTEDTIKFIDDPVYEGAGI